MFNSFLDGTKSALEMAAVANGCELSPPKQGLQFPPCGKHHLPHVLKPRSDGGQLDRKGMVEVVSSLELDGRSVFNDLRWGVYVVIEGKSPPISTRHRLLTDWQHPQTTRRTVSSSTDWKQTRLADTRHSSNLTISSASNSASLSQR